MLSWHFAQILRQAQDDTNYKVILNEMKNLMKYYVYIMTNKNNNVVYTGVTNNLQRRVYEHKYKLVEGFTSKYNLTKLVYFEEFNTAIESIRSEKMIKGWKRNKKDELVE